MGEEEEEEEEGQGEEEEREDDEEEDEEEDVQRRSSACSQYPPCLVGVEGLAQQLAHERRPAARCRRQQNQLRFVAPGALAAGSLRRRTRTEIGA